MMKRLLSSCQLQLVTKITNMQAVHAEKYCTQYEAYIYLKRHLFKKDCLYGLNLQLHVQLVTMTAVARAKNTASYGQHQTVSIAVSYTHLTLPTIYSV